MSKPGQVGGLRPRMASLGWYQSVRITVNIGGNLKLLMFQVKTYLTAPFNDKAVVAYLHLHNLLRCSTLKLVKRTGQGDSKSSRNETGKERGKRCHLKSNQSGTPATGVGKWWMVLPCHGKSRVQQQQPEVAYTANIGIGLGSECVVRLLP